MTGTLPRQTAELAERSPACLCGLQLTLPAAALGLPDVGLFEAVGSRALFGPISVGFASQSGLTQ